MKIYVFMFSLGLLALSAFASIDATVQYTTRDGTPCMGTHLDSKGFQIMATTVHCLDDLITGGIPGAVQVIVHDDLGMHISKNAKTNRFEVESDYDFALIRLSGVPHITAPYNISLPDDGEDVVVATFRDGLPQSYQESIHLVRPHQSLQFPSLLEMQTTHLNNTDSGAGVYDQSGALVGVLVGCLKASSGCRAVSLASNNLIASSILDKASRWLTEERPPSTPTIESPSPSDPKPTIEVKEPEPQPPPATTTPITLKGFRISGSATRNHSQRVASYNRQKTLFEGRIERFVSQDNTTQFSLSFLPKQPFGVEKDYGDYSDVEVAFDIKTKPNYKTKYTSGTSFSSKSADGAKASQYFIEECIKRVLALRARHQIGVNFIAADCGVIKLVRVPHQYYSDWQYVSSGVRVLHFTLDPKAQPQTQENNEASREHFDLSRHLSTGYYKTNFPMALEKARTAEVVVERKGNSLTVKISIPFAYVGDGNDKDGGTYNWGSLLKFYCLRHSRKRYFASSFTLVGPTWINERSRNKPSPDKAFLEVRKSSIGTDIVVLGFIRKGYHESLHLLEP